MVPQTDTIARRWQRQGSRAGHKGSRERHKGKGSGHGRDERELELELDKFGRQLLVISQIFDNKATLGGTQPQWMNLEVSC